VLPRVTALVVMSHLGRGPSAVAEYWRLLFAGDADAAWLRLEECRDGDAVLVRLELPGVDPERDVVLSITGGVLHVVAHRTRNGRHPEPGPVRSEFRYDSFTRHVTLPSNADEQATLASYQDGILEVRVPVDGERRSDPTPLWARRKATVTIPVSRRAQEPTVREDRSAEQVSPRGSDAILGSLPISGQIAGGRWWNPTHR